MGLHRPTVTRRRPDGTTFTERTQYWWGTYRDPATDKIEKVPLRTADKTAAATLLKEIERRAALAFAGLVNPFEAQQRRPLREHVDEFEKYLVGKGNLPRYARNVTNYIRRALEACRWRTWPDLSAAGLVEHLAELRRGGLAVKSSNHRLSAVKEFARWMVRDRRAALSPLAHLEAQNAKKDPRRVRRALDGAELQALLSAAAAGPEREKMPALARYWLYRLAVETGLRANELRGLTWGCLHLDGDAPALVVPAALNKSRREDWLPLRTATADGLGRWRGPAGADVRVFPNMPGWSNVAPMLRDDLAAARAAWLEAAGDPAERRRREKTEFLLDRNESGEVVDFHALRHTFITALARGGVHPKTAQALARHTTITLTMDRYTHSIVGEQRDALNVLPDFRGPEAAETQRVRATGTDDCCTPVVRRGVQPGPRMAAAGQAEVDQDDGNRVFEESGGVREPRRAGLEPAPGNSEGSAGPPLSDSEKNCCAPRCTPPPLLPVFGRLPEETREALLQAAFAVLPAEWRTLLAGDA